MCGIRELLGLYARYNATVTTELARMMELISHDDLTAVHRTYHESIHRLYHHLAIGSWYYLDAIRRLSSGKYCEDLPRLLPFGKDLPVSSISSFLAVLSDALVEVATEITDEDLQIVGTGVKIYNGRTVDISIWQYFLQHITHQTHHQGQLSILFDELGVEHEFGNIFPFIPDAPAPGH